MDGPVLLLVVIFAIAVAGFAKRLDLQVPLVLVTVGSIASFVPGVPHISLSPQLILGVVLALSVGAASGVVMGLVIAFTRASGINQAKGFPIFAASRASRNRPG